MTPSVRATAHLAVDVRIMTISVNILSGYAQTYEDHLLKAVERNHQSKTIGKKHKYLDSIQKI